MRERDNIGGSSVCQTGDRSARSLDLHGQFIDGRIQIASALTSMTGRGDCPATLTGESRNEPLLVRRISRPCVSVSSSGGPFTQFDALDQLPIPSRNLWIRALAGTRRPHFHPTVTQSIERHGRQQLSVTPVSGAEQNGLFARERSGEQINASHARHNRPRRRKNTRGTSEK